MTGSDANVVALADGSVAAIRPIAVGDGPVIAATFEALSPESRYRRFLQPSSELNERTLSFLLDVEHRRRLPSAKCNVAALSEGLRLGERERASRAVERLVRLSSHCESAAKGGERDGGAQPRGRGGESSTD